jgi:hypothetical protein
MIPKARSKNRKSNVTKSKFPCFFFKVIFEKLFFKLSCIYLSLKKLINKKQFQSKKNLTWFSEKCFPEKSGWKTLSGSCEKFRNIILFCFEYLFFNFIS